MLLFKGTINSEAATLYVPENYKTIQQAVENALPDDTVIVKDGNYEENIVVIKPLTIKSDKGSDATIIKASNPAEPVFRVINVNGVSIIGFTATGSALSGIFFYNSNRGVISDNKSIHNGIGIYLFSSTENVLTDNIADLNNQTGIYLELSNNNTLMKNSADSNKEKGIFLNTSNDNKLISNSASLNEWNGITLWTSNHNRVEDNEVLRNTYSIVISGSIDNILNNNYTWTNFYIILPIILIYIGILLYFIQRWLFRFIYRE